jgi:hypothetical protein
MPTGYTAKIADGISFEEYALGCARAFGALVMMRDEPSDAPIPEQFEPSPYHVERIAETNAELARVKSMTDDEAERAAKQAYEKDCRSTCDRIASKCELRAKYEAMLEKVEAFVPPTPDHVEYKTFMAQQIRQSIEFDCDVEYERTTAPKRLTGAAWKGLMIATLQRSLEYHAEQDDKERERAASRTAWVAALRRSLNGSASAVSHEAQS